MALINALLIVGAVLVWTLVFVWELSFKPRFLNSWLVWSATTGGIVLVVMFRSGHPVQESLKFAAAMPPLIALWQLRFRSRGVAAHARAAREAQDDAWGNPRPKGEGPKPDGSPPGS